MINAYAKVKYLLITLFVLGVGITRLSAQYDFQVEGAISALTTTSITVSGVDYEVNALTLVFDKNDNPILFSTLQVGNKVKISGVNVNNVKLAQIIKLIKDTVEINVSGTISALTNSTLTVNSKTFKFDTLTKFYLEGIGQVVKDSLKVGQSVEVNGITTGADTFALKVTIKAEHSKEIEAKGQVTALTQTSLTVYGITFKVDTNTKVNLEGFGPVKFDSVKVGQTVEVKGTVTGTDTLAVKITIMKTEQHKEIEANGKVTSLTPTSLTVNGITFKTDTNTKVVLEGFGPVKFDSVKVGQTVEVKGVISGTDTLATEIMIKKEVIDHNFILVKGLITGLTDSTITINGVRFLVDSATTYSLQDSGKVAFSYLKVGMTATVKGNIKGTDTVAVSVQIQKDKNNHNEIEVEGLITAITINSVTVEGITFTVNADTKIYLEDKKVVSISSLYVGQQVRIIGYQTGTDYFAKLIKINDQDESDDENDDSDNDHGEEHGHGHGKGHKTFVYDQITELTDSTIEVGGIIFYFTPKTKVFMRGKADISDLQVGQMVRVKGYKSGKLFYVQQIKIEFTEDKGIDLQVSGVITGLNNKMLIVGADTFLLNSQTLVVMENQGKVDLSQLKVGQFVDVKAYLSGKIYIAKIVKIKESNDYNFTVNGEITAKDDSSITVNSTRFMINSNTKFYDVDNQPLVFADFVLGMKVKVKATTKDSVNTALYVYVQRGPIFPKENVIYLIEERLLVVGSQIYYVNSSTEVFDELGVMTSYYALIDGQDVEVEENIINGKLYASKVRMLSSVTDVQTINSESLRLKNYPNPFVSTTNIGFTLVQEANVMIELYDEYGNKLTEIYNGQLSAGDYTFLVNLNDTTSTGAYFVKLTVNGKIQVLKLMKS